MQANLCPEHDPNYMPHLQGPSKTEKLFAQKLYNLHESQMKVQLCGCDWENTNQDDLNDIKKNFLKLNSFLIEYLFDDDDPYSYLPDYSRGDNRRDFRYFENYSLPAEDSDEFFCGLGALAQNPYEVLLSWQHEFQKLFRMYSTVNPSDFNRFCQATFYLLCLFVPNAAEDPRYNPMQIQKCLYHKFDQFRAAYIQTLDMYPPVRRNASANIDENPTAQDESSVQHARSTFKVYDFLLKKDTSWYSFADETRETVNELFDKHLSNNDIQIAPDLYELLISKLWALAKDNNKAHYLFPFICTKIFAEILSWHSGKRDKRNPKKSFEGHILEELYNYESFDRLFDTHQRRLLNNKWFFANSYSHPVIAFMQDIVALVYKAGITEAKIPRYMIVNQLDTNWFILYLFGNHRYFDNPYICLQFCDLTLPILLQHLFKDEEDSGQMSLSTDWLYVLANAQKLDIELSTERSLSKTGILEVESILTSPDWKITLAHYLFDSRVWETSKLNISLPEFQRQIDDINLKISKTADLLKEKNEDVDLAAPIIRNRLISHLFRPIIDDMEEFLNILLTPEQQWKLLQL